MIYKRIVLLSALLLAIAPISVRAEDYDVYLLAGQSNMDGRGQAADLSPAQRQPIDGTIIYYRNMLVSTDGWEPLSPGFSMPPGYKGDLPSPTFGPELGFAVEMRQAKPGKRIAIIKGSKGGTSLAKDWKPGTAGDPESQGERYRDFIETIRRATRALEERGDRFTIRGLLWHQGESDSKSSEETYRNRFMQFAERIREDTDIPNLPIVVGEVFDNGKRDQVRAALRSIGDSKPEFAFISSEGTKTWDDGTHFDAASQLLLGKRYARAILAVQQ